MAGMLQTSMHPRVPATLTKLIKKYMYFCISMFKRVTIFLCIAAALLIHMPSAAQKPSRQKPSAQLVETLVLKGVEAYGESRIKDAELCFETVLGECPDNDAAHFYMGMCKLVTRDIDAAEEHLKAAVRLDPGNFWYRYRLASLYAMAGRQEVTLAMYEELLKDFPRKSELYYGLFEQYVAQSRYDDALTILDHMDVMFGRTDEAAVARYRLLMELQRPQQAVDALLSYNRESSSPEVLSMLGDFEISEFRDSSALAYYEEALDIAPDFPPALLGRAEVYRMNRKYDRFFPLVGELMAMESVPAAGKVEYLKALTQRTDPRFLRGFKDELDKVHESALAAHPADSAILSAAGMYYLATDRKALADSCFRSNMLNYPDDGKALGTYCSFLSYTEDWNALDSLCEEALVRFPDTDYLLYYQGVAAYNKADYRKVIGVYQKLCDIAPTTEDKVGAMGNIGDMYQMLGETRKSYKVYDKALKLDPGYVPVLNNYAYFLSLEGRKLPKAYAMSRRAVEAEPDNPTYLDTMGWILHLMGRDQEAKTMFKHAMLYGGKDSATILDHYAEVLFALGDYNVAFVYWDQALGKAGASEVKDLEARIALRRTQMKK